MPSGSNPAPSSSESPTRSASRSASREKASCSRTATVCPKDNTPAAASGLLEAAKAARIAAAIMTPVDCRCCPIMREMCRWVTWPISWASTDISSDSVWACTTSPVCTPM